MGEIILQGVNKRYFVKKRAVDALMNISFSIGPGTFTAISGPSGSGKSTVLQLISGIEQPDSGHIFVNGQDISALRANQLAVFRNSNVGIVFQHFYLDPSLTLRQNIELPAIFSRLSGEERRKRTSELITLTGLDEYVDNLPSELSGGQIQRVAVARALYNYPSIIIADEPTSNLDQANATNIISLFLQIRDAYGTTVVIATHDATITDAADQVIKLDAGAMI